MKQEKLKTCFFPCTHAMTVLTEHWLSRQAAEGWKLYSKTLCLFTFITAKESNTEYCMYSSFGSEHGLYYDFLRAKDRYKKAGSNINKTENTVFEVDPCKIDREYYEFRVSRNQYYKKHYWWLFFFAFVFTASGFISAEDNSQIQFICFIFLPLLVYSVASLLILLVSSNRDKKP